MSAKYAFHNIFLPTLWTDETMMCFLVECTWYFEDLAFCLFNISELKDSKFHDTYLVFVYYIAIFIRALDFFTSFSCFVINFIRSYERKKFPVPDKTRSRRTLYWFIIYLFEYLVNEKNSIILPINFICFKCTAKAMCCL